MRADPSPPLRNSATTSKLPADAPQCLGRLGGSRPGAAPRSGCASRGRTADAPGQQRRRVRAGRDRSSRSRTLRPPLRRQSARPDCFSPRRSPRRCPPGADASIVNLIDQRVYKPTPRFLSYGLTKSALHAATTTLAQALAPRIRVNSVAPGPTLPSARQDAEAFARQSLAVPLGRGPIAGRHRRCGDLSRVGEKRDR